MIKLYRDTGLRAITAPSYKEPNSHNFKKTFTYDDFPYHVNVNKDKLALINRPWKCKKNERLTITANSFTKIDQLDEFCPLYM